MLLIRRNNRHITNSDYGGMISIIGKVDSMNIKIMGTLKKYKCNGCGYTITGTREGRTLVMSGETETTKVPRKCPKCGGDMKETGAVIMID